MIEGFDTVYHLDDGRMMRVDRADAGTPPGAPMADHAG